MVKLWSEDWSSLTMNLLWLQIYLTASPPPFQICPQTAVSSQLQLPASPLPPLSHYESLWQVNLVLCWPLDLYTWPLLVLPIAEEKEIRVTRRTSYLMATGHNTKAAPIPEPITILSDDASSERLSQLDVTDAGGLNSSDHLQDQDPPPSPSLCVHFPSVCLDAVCGWFSVVGGMGAQSSEWIQCQGFLPDLAAGLGLDLKKWLHLNCVSFLLGLQSWVDCRCVCPTCLEECSDSDKLLGLIFWG